MGEQLLVSALALLSVRQDLGLRLRMGAAFWLLIALTFGVSALATAARLRVWGGPTICGALLGVEICLTLYWSFRRKSA